jgi:hypothetical protein
MGRLHRYRDPDRAEACHRVRIGANDKANLPCALSLIC